MQMLTCFAPPPSPTPLTYCCNIIYILLRTIELLFMAPPFHLHLKLVYAPISILLIIIGQSLRSQNEGGKWCYHFPWLHHHWFGSLTCIVVMVYLIFLSIDMGSRLLWNCIPEISIRDPSRLILYIFNRLDYLSVTVTLQCQNEDNSLYTS